jgi:hypothetical protein
MPGPPQIDDGGEAHDILAAEEFAMPAEDPTLHHGPVSLPEDPSGDTEPHDILAAEEFAMPALPPWESGLPRPRRASPAVPAALALGALMLLLVALLRRRAR